MSIADGGGVTDPGVLDLERDRDPVAGQRHAADPADGDAGDCGPGCPAAVRPPRRSRPCRWCRRRCIGRSLGKNTASTMTAAEWPGRPARRDRVAFLERPHDRHLAAVTGTPPWALAAAGAVDAGDRGVAEVEVEPGSVGGQPGDVLHLDRQVCRNVSTVGSCRPGWWPAAGAGRCRCCSGARPTWSRPAVALVRLPIAEIAVPIGSRSAASPDTSSGQVSVMRPGSSPRGW